MNVKTGPVRGGSRFRRHRGDKFRLTAQHLFRGLQQEASALGGYGIAPLRERRAGGSGAAAGVRQAGGAGNGGAFVRERIIAGKGGMTFSIMPLVPLVYRLQVIVIIGFSWRYDLPSVSGCAAARWRSGGYRPLFS